MKKLTILVSVLFFFFAQQSFAQEADTILDLWEGEAPGEAMNVGDEQDFTKPTDILIAGRRIIKLGNVKSPQIHVFRPEPTKSNGTAVVICPGGGFTILAWDLEGTEVAEYLNTLGVTGIVLKYRVPTREQNPAWLAPTQDAQRAIRLSRYHADDLGIDPERIGILGFSAGGKTAAMASLLDTAQYEPTDQADELSFKPNFGILIYPAQLTNKEGTKLLKENPVTENTPPMFLAQSVDDFARVENSLILGKSLKKNNIPFDMHIYSEGGHGYGLRITDKPITTWHHRLEDWMRINAWIGE